jgi:hypothetical protein
VETVNLPNYLNAKFVIHVRLVEAATSGVDDAVMAASDAHKFTSIPAKLIQITDSRGKP